MSNLLSPIIKPHEWLALKQTNLCVLVDARAGAGAKERYATNHLEGARHADLDSQLADIKPNAADGGRHPLPSLTQFAEVLTHLGITPNSHVVIYDDKNGANAAARFWWMLKSIGHKAVQVLDGGMDAAIKAGHPLSNQAATGKEQGAITKNALVQVPYLIQAWQLPMADIDEVDKATHDKNSLIIDVREAGRYNGEFEPIDLIAGHIPYAVNIPFSSNLDKEGYFLSPSELRVKYENALTDKQPEQVIVHCGSGVTACHTLLAMDYAGMAMPKLYVGSWSEWSRNDRPLITKTKD